MQFEIEEKNAYTRQITLKVEPEELVKIENKVIRDIQKTTQIPGFRKGRVPASIIKQRYADTIRAELMETALTEYYGKVLDEAKIIPIAQGKIQDVKFDSVDQGMEVLIEVEVEPEIEIKKYKGLKVEKEIPVVTEEMVDRVLENLRHNYAISRPAEKVEKGFYVKFDAQALGEGNVPIVGRKFEDIEVEVGKGDFDIEIEEQLIGLKVGETRIVEKQSPNPNPEASDQPIIERYEIAIKSVEEREIPELDDDFVKNLGEEDLETVDQLRQRVRENLEQDLQKRAAEQFRNRLIDELLKENPFDVPESMVEHYLDHIVEDVKKQTQEGQPFDEKMVRENYRPDAIHNIRWYLIKKKLAEMENINITMEEVNQLIDESQMDENYKKFFKENVQYLDQMRDDLLEQKVLKLLEDNAEVTEIYPPDLPKVEETAADKEEKKKDVKKGKKKSGQKKTAAKNKSDKKEK